MPTAGHYYVSGVDVVVPPPGDDAGRVGLSALIHALNDTGMVALVRYVKRKNSSPILGVLTPCAYCCGTTLFAFPPVFDPAVPLALPCAAIVTTRAAAAAAGEEHSTFEVLYLNVLPFAEDLRLYTFPDLDATPAFVPSAGEGVAGLWICAFASLHLPHAVCLCLQHNWPQWTNSSIRWT